MFDDEFNGSTLDASKWATCYWWSSTTCTNGTTGELEQYQPGNVSVGDGMLHLTARKEPASGDNRQFAYTSGIVSGASPSSTLFSFEYGYVDARARVPAGQGLWSGFWMLPVDRAALPEIDLFEVFGQQPAIDHTTTHWASGPSARQRGRPNATPDLSAGWHDFGFEWDSSKLVWYLDGHAIWRVTRQEEVPGTQMYLLANLAVGGTFGGPPSPQTTFPSSLVFDYVRVWQRA